VEDDALLGRSTVPEALRRIDGLLLVDRLRVRLAALVLGRFEPEAGANTEVTEMLAATLGSHPALQGVPVVVDVPFGHAVPRIPLPLGAQCTVSAMSHGASTISIWPATDRPLRIGR